MKFVSHLLAWMGRTVANIVGGLILLVAAVSLAVGLVNGSTSAGVNAGAKVGYAVVHYTTVAAGIVTSYSDDVGPSFSSGRDLGNQQAGGN